MKNKKSKYAGMKRIAMMNHRIENEIKKLEEYDESVFDECIHYSDAQLVHGCKVIGNHLIKDGIKIAEGVDGYFVKQYVGCCEDDFYGWLYFSTDIPGEYVKVGFNC